MRTIYLLIACYLFGLLNLFAQNLEIYVSSRAENAIKQYDENGMYQGDFISANLGNLADPQDIIFLDNNTVIVSGSQNTSIKQYASDTGNYIGDFTSGYSLNRPTRMVIKDDLLYIIQWANSNNKVVRFDLNGNFVDEFTSIGISQSIGIDWDNAGNLYISSYGQGTNGFVQKFDSSGNDMGVFIDSSILQGPTNIWFNSNQDLFVEDWSLGIVRRFSSTGQYIDDFITGMTNPEGIAFSPNGDLLICDWGTDTVEKFDADGNSLGTLISGNNLADPNAVIIRDPNLLVDKFSFNEIMVTPTVGIDFKLTLAAINQINFFSVYNSAGVLVDTVSLSKTNTWNASRFSEGIYFIVAKNHKQSKLVQKIVVQN